ncbi:hypothetical protein [Segatella oulorum]|uniref:hypothetical protein n=1 Tax=Segatella oulorum TaxID=28136 RepID=UPI0023F341D7|nr:hypothetical protein [Segatella oulorum]
MKEKLLIWSMLLMPFSVMGQTANSNTNSASKDYHKVAILLSKVDSLLQANNFWLSQIETDLSSKNRFKLYKTENIYNFLELDTKTGIIRQVQWSLDENKEGEMFINSEDLSIGKGYYGPGTFELYPTSNMFQFILIDKVYGRKWHIQWGMEENKRWIRRISRIQ